MEVALLELVDFVSAKRCSAHEAGLLQESNSRRYQIPKPSLTMPSNGYSFESSVG